MIRVALADDQTVVREGLRAMLGLFDQLDVVAAVDSAEALVAAVAELAPDVALTDLRMPGIGGVEGIRRIRAEHPATQCVALTTYDDDRTIAEAMSAGAVGFLNKDADPASVVGAIEAAASGRSLLDARVLDALLRGSAAPSAAVPPPASGLTEREIEVVRLIAAGRSNQQICHELVVSMATVKTHVNHLLAKTGCRDRAALVSWAYAHGLAG